MTKDNTLPIVAHVLGLLTSWLGPLIILLAADAEKDKQHARRALNWQLSLILYFIALIIIGAVSIPLAVIIIGFFTGLLALLAIVALRIASIVFPIIAAVRASEGKLWDYPFTIAWFRDPVPGESDTSKSAMVTPVTRDAGPITQKQSQKKSRPKKASKKSTVSKESKASSSKKGASKK